MNIFSLAPTTEGAYSIPMAIVDFLPVLFYFLASWLIARDLYNKTTKTAFSFLATGSIMVFIGGAFKALYGLEVPSVRHGVFVHAGQLAPVRVLPD
ncbi:MAG: hypothetical protein II742_05320, partial [Clostridia bacterium]|nr:hypothetical protein [Clostridia bacterium]